MSRFPVAFRLPAFASRSSDSRQGIGSPYGRPTGPRAGPRRGYRVPHARAATGVGAPYTPRTVVLARPSRLPDRHPPLPSGSPSTPPRHPTMRGSASRGINRGSSHSPVRSSPRPRPRGGTGDASAFPLSFAPHRHRRRTSGRGQAIEHGPGTTLYDICRTSDLACSLNACDLASHGEEQERD